MTARPVSITPAPCHLAFRHLSSVNPVPPVIRGVMWGDTARPIRLVTQWPLD
jgi:hypothetical protein